MEIGISVFYISDYGLKQRPAPIIRLVFSLLFNLKPVFIGLAA